MEIRHLPWDEEINILRSTEAVPVIVDMIKAGDFWETGKGEHRKTFSNIIGTFDIETTKLLNENWNKKMSESYHYFEFPFCWQAVVGDVFGNCIYIEGSNVQQYFDMLHDVGDAIGDIKVVWWIHNLAFEGNNLADYFYLTQDFEKGFWKSSSSPLFIQHKNHQFRCSAQLTHKSLAQLGEDIGYQKLKGDFDYSKKRDYEENGYAQTAEEHNYRYRDVMILYKYILQECTRYCSQNKMKVNSARLPYTQTGYVRTYIQKHFSKTGTGYHVLESTKLTQYEYASIRPAFFGGFVHENFRYVGKAVPCPLHTDIVSAYPGVICLNKFIWHLSEEQNPDSKLYVKNLYRKDYGQIADVIINNVRLKKGRVPFIPYTEGDSKVTGVNVIEEAGKVIMADTIVITVFDSDMRLILRNYDIEEIKVRKLFVGYKKPLPYPVIDAVLYFYEQKTTLKGLHSSDGSIEYQYMLYKQMLNSIYGCAAQDRMLGDYHLEGLTAVPDPKEYKEADTLPYQWALQITAYVREIIYSFVSWLTEHEKDGECFYYSDTDSVFCKDTPGARAYLERYNKQVRRQLEKLRNRHFNAIPKNNKGQEQYLKTLDVEDDDAVEFGTIGPKRYYIKHSDGTVDITFSGLRATKTYYDEKGVRHNGRNTERLLQRYGTIGDVFRAIVNSDIDLEYEEGTDKLSNYNVRYNFRNTTAFGRVIERPCSYTLYGMGTRLSLNESLNFFLKSETREEIF